MSLPFTIREFLDVFARYNNAIWPFQLVMTAAAVGAVVLALRGGSGRLVGTYLAAQWVWTGVAYHWLFFSPLNPAARGFAVLWVAGALAFLWAGIWKGRLAFRTDNRPRRAVGAVLIAYALVIYPILGHFDGRAYPFSPTYGAPCPVTILTFGLLWLARPPLPRYLLVAPALWAAVGGSAAFALQVTEDLGLVVAGLSGIVLALLPAPPPRAKAPRQVHSV
jgi:hypothetical protein